MKLPLTKLRRGKYLYIEEDGTEHVIVQCRLESHFYFKLWAVTPWQDDFAFDTLAEAKTFLAEKLA